MQKKKGRRERRNFGKRAFRAPTEGRRATVGSRPTVAGPRLAGNQSLPASCAPQFVRLQVGSPFPKNLAFYILYFWNFGDGLGILGEWVYSTPIF
jgi:hypothetical protein